MGAKHTKKQNVLIKGTKDGLTFFLNDQCTFETLINELEDKLSERLYSNPNEEVNVRVKLVVGKRYLDTDQIDLLGKTLFNSIHGIIDSIDSDVITKEEAINLSKDRSVQRMVKVVRSGQIVDVEGDLLLLGDVNPGGTVKAKGNIFVMGKLLGSAHAGSEGKNSAVVCAASMQPSQLRIGNILWKIPDGADDNNQLISCAYVNEHKNIVIESVHKLLTNRPEISQLFNC